MTVDERLNTSVDDNLSETHRGPASTNGLVASFPGRQFTLSWPLVVLALLSLFAFFMHFRPWGGGLLEDWDFKNYWLWWGFRRTLTSDLAWSFFGRPLFTFSNVVGFWIGQGSFVGAFLVLGLSAMAQVWLVWWALRPLIASEWLIVGLAALYALHPWWDAGLVLRFVHAQVAMVLVALWLGAVVRYLRGNSSRWLIGVFAFPVLALFNYQAAALAVLVGVVALAAVTDTTWRTRLVALGTTLAGVAFSIIWTIFIAPLITHHSYETEVGTNAIGISGSLLTLLDTVRFRILAVVIGAVVILLLAAMLLWKRRLQLWQGLLILASMVLIPATGLIFMGNQMWLQDPERVAIPTGLTTWLIICALASLTAGIQARWQNLTASLAILACITTVLAQYRVWTEYERLQQGLLAAIGPLRAGLPPQSEIFVEDLSGDFGRLYSFHPGYLQSALTATFGPSDTPVTLCSNPAALAQAQAAYQTPPLPREWVSIPSCADVAGFESAPQLGVIDVDGRSLNLRLVTNPGLDQAISLGQQ